MREADKAARRRLQERVFVERYFVGTGIDIGAGEAPLSSYVGKFNRMKSVRAWDIGDGDAQLMIGVADEAYDFVHSSHCLEHLENPSIALRNWLRILRPGGYLIVTVPDEDLYERGHWPSQFNSDHKWSFTLCKANSSLPRSVNVVSLLHEFANEVQCERIIQLRDQYDERVASTVDQTLGDAECAIEWVWRKVDPNVTVRVEKSTGQWLHEGIVAEHQANDDQTAEHAYRAAVAAQRPSLDAYNALAHLLTRLARYDEVEALWSNAAQRLPNAQTRIFQALFLLQLGKFREGFRVREASVSDTRRTPTLPEVPYPRWQGERLEGKSIVIWTEFGFGDEIMFSRFALDLKTHLNADRVTVLCQDALYPLLRDALIGADLVMPVSRRADLPLHDYWVFPHSIPVYRTLSEHSIPGAPYLHVAAIREMEIERGWRWTDNRYKVGLVWHGNPTHENDANRSLSSLALLQDVLSVQNVTFVSLQSGKGEEEARQRARTDPKFFALGHRFSDFRQTAAAIANLDLVISVDTAVTHLAGAMGKPVWLLLPTVCDWRWMLERQDSPWYPAMHIFRQERLGQWQPVLSRVAFELSRWRDRAKIPRNLRRDRHASLK